MGVYIKGMEMPVSYKDIRIYADGRIVSKSLYMYGEEIATAVPIQPHGRLIDADEMRDEWLINGENEYVYDTNAFLESIDNQPTVISAELGGAEGK